ncbi:MAG: branched-chain amino acid ABC transporter permease [Oscillospiraceae bacterium]|nr:branched-chain amino acid ABC transporter permease [Oscillospiraceae bacterium]
MKNLLQNKKLHTVGLPYIVVIIGFIVLESMRSGGMLTSTVSGYLVPICVYISLAVSLNLLVGVCGELSLGHAGFMGIGAFSGIVIAALLKGKVESDVLRLLLAMLGGGVFAGALGFLIGIPVLRLRGDYLAIVTLAFGEILKNIIGNLYVGTDSAGFHMALSTEKMELLEGGVYFIAGPKGATGVQKLATFGMGIVLVLFTLFVVQNLIHSKEGRAIKAVRDNRIAAESVGINVTAFRMKAFVVSAFLAGMAGALFGLNYSSVTASKFNFNTSINILVFVVLGGMGNILGSVISATVLYILPEAMRELEDYRMILYAVVLILVMLCTWSPKVKGALQVVSAKMKEKISQIFRKKEGTDHA